MGNACLLNQIWKCKTQNPLFHVKDKFCEKADNGDMAWMTICKHDRFLFIRVDFMKHERYIFHVSAEAISWRVMRIHCTKPKMILSQFHCEVGCRWLRNSFMINLVNVKEELPLRFFFKFENTLEIHTKYSARLNLIIFYLRWINHNSYYLCSYLE